MIPSKPPRASDVRRPSSARGTQDTRPHGRTRATSSLTVADSGAGSVPPAPRRLRVRGFPRLLCGESPMPRARSHACDVEPAKAASGDGSHACGRRTAKHAPAIMIFSTQRRAPGSRRTRNAQGAQDTRPPDHTRATSNLPTRLPATRSRRPRDTFVSNGFHDHVSSVRACRCSSRSSFMLA